MATLDEIGTYLETQGVGTQATDLFLRSAPDTPDACVAVLEYGGAPPVPKMGNTPGAVILERPRIQVRARAATYTAAETKAKAAWSALHWFVGTLSGTVYYKIEALQSPFLLERDENNRFIVGFNCQIEKDRST